MSNIEEYIAPQKFEVVTTRIATILTDELANQYSLSGNTEEILNDVVVYFERYNPLNTTEYPAIIVRYSGSDYKGNTRGEQQGDNIFFIDVYNSAKDTDSTDIDVSASNGVKRLLGVCRSILANPYYVSLGFNVIDPNEKFIGVSYPRNIQMSQQADNTDTEYVMMGRLQHDVRMSEDTGKISPSILENYVTEARLFDTEVGLRYEQEKN
jgi:hypothetical protein